MVRMPAVLVLAFTAMRSGNYAEVPANGGLLVMQASCEFLFGMVIGLVPLLIIAGVQTAAQLASTSMGFGAGALMDPSTGAPVSDLGRICGDLSIIMFLMIGGDHVTIHALSGLAGDVQIGSFLPGEISANLLIERTGHIFYVGMMVAAPVIVALLLTQFVMGLITRAVPTVNIFIISFPLTIGIGLVLTVLALPDIMVFVRREITGIEETLLVFLQDTRSLP